MAILSKKQTEMFQIMEDAGVLRTLQLMEQDESLKTESSYSANGVLYPDHQIPFAKKHMAYLMSHPNVNPDQYLSNLRLIIKIR
jgi:hypothetical protein